MITYAAKDYSRGRLSAMGIATLLIVWFHSSVIVPESGLLHWFKAWSDIGVDMFLFASGVGIYFALQKGGGFLPYFRKRLRRVAHPFLIVFIPWYIHRASVLGGGHILDFLMDTTLLSFWLEGDLGSWYVAAILALYLVTPVYVKLWERYDWINKAGLAASILVAILVQESALRESLGHLQIFLFRIPIYLFGLSFGKAIREERVFRVPVVLILAVLAGSIYIVLSCYGQTGTAIAWSYKYLTYAPGAVVLSLLCAKIPSNPVLRYLGGISFEVYLIFEKVLWEMSRHPPLYGMLGKTEIVYNLFGLAVTLVLAEVLRRVCGLIGESLWFKRLLDNPIGKR